MVGEGKARSCVTLTVLGRSKCNAKEARVVVDVVRAVLRHGALTRSDVGVVSPYTGQVRALAQQFGQEAVFNTATERCVRRRWGGGRGVADDVAT